jgi:FkbM family methyltransferase
MNFYGQSIATGGGSIDPIDKILYERYFTDKPNGIAVECGANDGRYVVSCLSLEEIGWKVYNVEASIINFNSLIYNRPNSINLFYALSDTNYDVIHIHNYNGDNGGMNSIDISQTNLMRFGHLSTTTAPTSTYDRLFGDIDVDLFILDVEGYELNVIKGMNLEKNSPKIMCIEHNAIGLDNLIKALPMYKLDFNDDLNAVFVR